MRVLCTARTTLRDFGRYRYRKIVEGFIKEGWEVTLLGYCHDFGQPIKGLHREVVVENITMTSPEPSDEHVKKIIIKAKEVIQKEKFDAVVILYPDPIPGITGIEIGKILKLPVFMDYGDFFSGLVAVQFKLSKKKKKEFEKKEEYVIKNSDYIIIMNDFLKNRCLSLGKKKSQLVKITNGADVVKCSAYHVGEYRERYNLEKERITILFVGTLSYDKGLYMLLKAIPKIFKGGYKVQFVIAGKGDDKKVKEFIRKLPREQAKHVHFTGPHRREWIRRVFCEAEIIAIPFMPTKFSIASCPLKVFEAMASKTCIVASALPGIAEIVEDNKTGLLFKPKGIKQFIEKLETLIKNEKLRKRLKKNAYREFTRKYRWELIQKKYCDFVYRKIKGRR
jgi:glycosyltransferase involved in cell wall biosynthesis